MRLAIFLLFLLFVFLAFIGKLNYDVNNPFVSYFLFILETFIKIFPIVLIIFSITSGYLIWKHYNNKHTTRKTLHSFFLIFEVIFISIFSAFIFLFILGFIQLNIYSLIISKDPTVLGIKTTTEQVYGAINNNGIAPVIIPANKEYKTSVIEIAKASSGTDNFYGEIVLSNIPKFLILPANKEVPNLLFLDNTLIITKVDKNDMEKLSPLVGHLFLQNYFSRRQIKAYPKVNLMDENEYQIYRKKDAEEKINKINLEANKMEDSVSSTSASISETEAEIEENSQSKLTILENRDKEYNACLSKGRYDEDNNFIPDNTKADCKYILEEWEPIYISEEESGNKLVKKLEKDKEDLKAYEYYNTFFKSQKELSNLTNENIPSELGVFIPEDKIKVVLLNYDSKAVANYFVTLVHEYLHYAAYVKGKRLESSFFEEGLTEYFAKNAIENTMGKETNIGYPVIVKLIEQFMNKIPEQDFADIYFTKDQVKLIDTLNLVYGDNFFQNNIVLIESLMYISDPEQSLELANKLMDEIGGEKLTKDDLYSN